MEIGTEYLHDGGGADSADKSRYLWPYINLEVLLLTTTILQLLNSRGRNPSSVFAAMDWDSTELGRANWTIKVIKLEMPRVRNLSSTDPEHYGELRPAIEGEIPN